MDKNSGSVQYWDCLILTCNYSQMNTVQGHTPMYKAQLLGTVGEYQISGWWKIIDDYMFIVGVMAAIIGLGKRPWVISNMTVQEWDFSSKLYATTSTDSGELRVVYVFKHKTSTSGGGATGLSALQQILSSNCHKWTETWTRIHPEHNWRSMHQQVVFWVYTFGVYWTLCSL